MVAGRIRVARSADFATVTLDRPDKLNAMTLPMYDAFGEAFAGISADSAIRCVVIEGAGERAFCAGSDIAGFDDTRLGSEQARIYADRTNGSFARLYECPHPTLAKIRGFCIGGGLEMAVLCDLRICSSDSRFGIPPNRLGLTLDYEELRGLCDLIGRRRALEMLLEGRTFDADEALRIGLVTRVVAPDELDAEIARTVERITRAAPLSNRWHKAFIRRLDDPAPLSEAERAEPYRCYDTSDYREGVAAFNEKRRPSFTGH